MNYHIDATKISMHTRMRKKAGDMEQIVIQARRDESSSKQFKDSVAAKK